MERNCLLWTETCCHALNIFHLLPASISCQRELPKGNEDTFGSKALKEQKKKKKRLLNRIVKNRFSVTLKVWERVSFLYLQYDEPLATFTVQVYEGGRRAAMDSLKCQSMVTGCQEGEKNTWTTALRTQRAEQLRHDECQTLLLHLSGNSWVLSQKSSGIFSHSLRIYSYQQLLCFHLPFNPLREIKQ